MAQAQTGAWDLTVVLAPTLPARVDVLAKQPGYLTIVVTYTGSSLENFELRSRLSSSSGLTGSTSSVPRAAPGPGTHIFSNTTRSLVDDATLLLPKAWEQLALRGGMLPADRYRYCASVYVNGAAVTTERCATAIIEAPQPPTLLLPADGMVIPQANPTFAWTPATQVDATSRVRYLIRVAELPKGRLPAEALGALAWFEGEVDGRTQLVYPFTALPLRDGVSYAWQVTAYDADGAPYGMNGGRSRIQRFTYRDPAATAALGAVEVTAGVAMIPSLRTATVVGGDADQLIVSGPVPLTLTIPGMAPRTLTATARELVVLRGPGAPRVVGGDLEADLDLLLGPTARVQSVRRAADGSIALAGVFRLGGVEMPATGSTTPGVPLLATAPAGANPLARIGDDTAAVVVRSVRLARVGVRPQVAATVELFGAAAPCAPTTLAIDDSSAVAELNCTASADAAARVSITTVRGRFRAASDRLVSADLTLALSSPIPFAPAPGAMLLNGRFTKDAGFTPFAVRYSIKAPTLRFGALSVRLRSAAPATVGWTPDRDWAVASVTRADLAMPSLGLAIAALDSVLITPTTLRLPGVERDGTAFGVAAFTGGDVRVRPQAVRWKETGLAFDGRGEEWRAELSGVGGVAHVSACVQGLRVPATRGQLTVTRLEWPLDTARTEGACVVRKPDGSTVAIDMVTGTLGGAVDVDTLRLMGRAAFVERTVKVATAPPPDSEPPPELPVPAQLRVPGGAIALRDAAGQLLLRAARVDARTFEFTPDGPTPLAFTLTGGLAGTARFTRLRFDTQSERIIEGTVQVAFAPADAARRTPLAALPAAVDSLVVQGDPLAPTARLYATLTLFGRAVGAPQLFTVDEAGVVTGRVDAVLANAAAYALTPRLAMTFAPSRLQGSLSIPLDGGPWQRDLVVDGELRALGLTRRFALRVPARGEGAVVVLSAGAPVQGAPPDSLRAGAVRLDSLQVGRLAWSAASGFSLRSTGSGRLLLPLRDGGSFEVPLPSVLLTEQDLVVGAARVDANTVDAVALAPGMAARAVSWDLPAWTVTWAAYERTLPASVSGDLQLQYDRIAALGGQRFAARLTWRADSTVCGTAIARPLARAPMHRQGGADLQLTDVAPIVPSCDRRIVAFGASVQATLARPASLTAAVDAWALATPLQLDAANGTLSGADSLAAPATARTGALELTFTTGRFVVRPDSVRWEGRASGRLVAPPAPPTPSGTANIVYDVGRGRLVSGRIEITSPFTWRVASGAGVVIAQVPRALLDGGGATFVGLGSVTGTDATISVDSLHLGADGLRVDGGRARILGTLPLALDANGWRVADAGLVTLPLVDPILDASGLSAQGAGSASIAVAGFAANALTVRLADDFRFDVDAGAVRAGRADLLDGAGAAAPLRGWVDSTGLNVVGAAPTLADSVALPGFDIAYARLRVNGQPVVTSAPGAGSTLTLTTAAAGLDVVFPALGGLVVPMRGSFSIDVTGRVTGGSLSASPAVPLAIAGAVLPMRVRGLSFGQVNGVFAMRATVAAPALPGLPDFAPPASELSLTPLGLTGRIATGSCAPGAPSVAERSYASGALTLQLLGVEADIGARTLCARLAAVARIGAAGAPATTIPVVANWNIASGRWDVTATAQQLPEITVGTAIIAPSAAAGVTVLAQDPGTFAIVLRGGVRFPQALGDGTTITIDELRIATDGVRVTANSQTPQVVGLFDELVSMRTSRIQVDYAAGVLSLTLDGALTLAGEEALMVEGLRLRSAGSVEGGTVTFGRQIGVLGGRLQLGSLAFSAVGGRLGADIGGTLSLPAPFGNNAPFTIAVRPSGQTWSAALSLPALSVGSGLVIGDNPGTEVAFGDVATFDLLGLGISLDLRAPANARITAAAALYLMNNTQRAIVFGDPANAAATPGLRIDRLGVQWNASIGGGLPSLNLGLFRYALTGFSGASAGGSFGFEFSGQASLDVPGVTGTMALQGLRIGLDGVTPGALGAGPHELSLLGGIASFRIGSLQRGTNTALELTGAGAAGSANASTSTVQAVEFVRLTDARLSLGGRFLEGSVREVLVYRLADGTRSIGVANAALSLAGVAEVNASMRYVNGPDGFRLSAGGSATIAGGSGFGAAGFFSNRGNQLGAGLFVAASASIPILPPLIDLAGIGGGLFINPTAEDVQMVLDVVAGLGMRLVGTPPPLPRPGQKMGFAAFLYADAGLIGAAGAYAIEGKAFLQVTSAYTRIDVRGVLLGQEDRLMAGVMLQVEYGDGWAVTGHGEAVVDFPGVDGDASLDFLLSRRQGRFTWAIQAQASLDVVAFNASGAFFASPDGFYVEVGMGSGFSYGPVEIGASVVIGVFLDVSLPKFGAFGIVSANVDLSIAEVGATLKGALVVSGSGVYLGFGGTAHARVGDLEASASVHVSFDDGDFSAGFGRDAKLDRVIAEMRATANRLEQSTGEAAAALRAAVDANWWRTNDATLADAGFALLTLPDADRERILAPVFAAEARTVLPARDDINGQGLAPEAARRWVIDSVLADPTRPSAAVAEQRRSAFEALARGNGAVAATVLERLHIAIADLPEVPEADIIGGSPLTVRAVAGRPLSLSVDADAYDNAAMRIGNAGADSAASLEAMRAVLAQAEGALDSVDAVFGGDGMGYGGNGGLASVGVAGELFALTREWLEAWQAERIAVASRARLWSITRRTRLENSIRGTTERYRLGWNHTIVEDRFSYRLLGEAAVARHQAVLDLAAASPTFRDGGPQEDAQAFRTRLFALDTVVYNNSADGPFLGAVAGTWEELWITIPRLGLDAAGNAAVADVRALLPLLALQRDSLAQNHNVLTRAVAELYAGRLELTAFVAALYDDARLLPGAPAAWTARRNELMADLEPPSLGGIQVQTNIANGIASSAVSWTASHPNGLGGTEAAVTRDGSPVPQYIGGWNGLTTIAARESDNADATRRYAIGVRARSRAGATVTRSATVMIAMPPTPIYEGSSASPVTTAADVAPGTPYFTLPYTLIEPLPVYQAAGGVGLPGLDEIMADLETFARITDQPPLPSREIDAPPPGAGPGYQTPPPPPPDTRVHFTSDRTAVDVNVTNVRESDGDIAAFEVAIGTTPDGEDARAFAAAPAVRTGNGEFRLLLRGLMLQRNVTYWVRLRLRDVAGQRSAVRTATNAVVLDDSPPAAPTLRAVEYRDDGSAVVRVAAVAHAPSPLRMFEYAISATADGEATFSFVTPVPWTADTVVIPAADLSGGRTAWLHIRAVTYAGMRGSSRSIEVRRPPSIAEMLESGPGALVNRDVEPVFSPFVVPGASPLVAPPTVPPTVPPGSVPGAAPPLGVPNIPPPRVP